MTRLVVLIVLAAMSSACNEAYVERPTQAVYDPSSSDFWALPLPSDLRRQPDGTLGLGRWPGDWNSQMVAMWLAAADAELTDGWGLSSGVFLRVSGALDPSSLPATPEASVAPDATVQLIDIDPNSPERGRRFPLEVQYADQGDRYAPNNLLSARPLPGFLRLPLTHYALVVTDGVKDAQGQALGRSRPFHDLITGQGGSAGPLAHLAKLTDFLASDDALKPEQVVAAAVFRTTDPNRTLLPLAAWYESLPTPELTEPWTLAETYPDYQVLNARYRVPVIQHDTRPYARSGEGLLAFTSDGTPEVRGHQDVRLALTIPRRPQPEDGFPLTVYMHGSGGNWHQAIERGAKAEVEDAPDAEPGTGPAAYLARRGVATVAFDFPLHGDRNSPPDTTGLMLYNLTGNVRGTIANFNAAAAELTLLSRLMLSTRVDAALSDDLDPGSAPDGTIGFDPARLSAMGQSMGSTLGTSWATIDPRLKGIMLSGSGGSLIEIAVAATEPFDVRNTLELFMGMDRPLHRAHPLLHAMQNVWDLVDPVVKGPYVVARPHPGIPPKDVLMSAGIRDGYFHPRAENALAIALQIPLVGSAVDAAIVQSMALAGVPQADYPLKGNVNGKAAAVAQYAAPFSLGHYVAFNQAEARHTYTCFLQSVGTALGTQIVAGDPNEGACP
jgi:hypothetical protein